MDPVVELLLGIVCAFAGGELFLRGVLGISAWARVPRAVTAATLAAFATSSPEISVAIIAATDGKTELALGDALGSNVVNVALILGLVLCIGPLRFEWRPSRQEFLFALVTPFLILAILADGRFSRAEAVGCLVLFGVWLLLTLREALRERAATPATVGRREGAKAVGLGAVGFALLALAGRLIVSGATGIGTRVGLDPFLVGVTLVALGTSTPELATAVVSKLRGHDEVGVGTILGSNIFNCLFIVGLAAVIRPFDEPAAHVLPSILIGVTAVALLTPLRSSVLGRRRGGLLLAVYAASIAVAWLTWKGGH